MPQDDVLIVGAGLAGLACALGLRRRGLSVTVLEASNTPGGRMRTDTHEGFLLDRGFQILLTSYPAVQNLVDLNALKPGAFYPGAAVHLAGRLHRMPDPWRRPIDAAVLGIDALARLGELSDSLRIAGLRRRALEGDLDDLFARPETSTARHLADAGVSAALVDHFFRPYLGGIFLESALTTSSRMFEFVFRMMATGDAVLPAGGMGAIPAQLAAKLGAGRLRLASPVSAIAPGVVALDTGEILRASAVVVAVEETEARRLLGLKGPLARPRAWNAVTCVYFDAPAPLEAPLNEPMLLLSGDRGSGLINNVVVPSAVVPGYAPPGRALVSVSVLGDPQIDDATLDREVRRQLRAWFGQSTEDWRSLRTYRVRQALPAQPPGILEPPQRPASVAPGLFICGDHTEHASTQGALASGLRAAAAVAQHLAGP